MTTDYEKNWWITEAMQHYGGSFVRELGKLWRRGDLDNQRRLQTAFPEYWKEYSNPQMIARVMKSVKGDH